MKKNIERDKKNPQAFSIIDGQETIGRKTEKMDIGTKKEGTSTPDVGDCRSSTGGGIEKQMFLLSKEGNPYDIPGLDCPEEKKSSFFPNIQNNFELHTPLHN
ncbi:hypothetical protein TNCT_279031 [Trichonephila clavata]|uniref:Uncharacterized protein n=1 Tax=Trichonephila clavata TaxID=2740835 RepID=A0A8X6FA99_TRICU|nr:hypothetical protein TNCT_279031 [Trichonephila clavata]